MTNQVKKFIKKINSDQALKAKFQALVQEDQKEIDRDAFITEKVLPLAKEAGYDLTAEDFKTDDPASGEISDAELAAVAGGGGCGCSVAGGGGGTDADDSNTYGCACVMYGQGGDGRIEDFNCICALGGVGSDEGV